MAADEALQQAERTEPSSSTAALHAGHVGQRALRARNRGCGPASCGSAGTGTASTISALLSAARASASSRFSVASKPVELRGLHAVDRAVVAEDLAPAPRRRRITEPPISPRPTTQTGVFVTPPGWHIAGIARRQAWSRLLVKPRRRGLPLAHMGAQSAPAQGQAADMPDGFGVAVVREDGEMALRRDAHGPLEQLDRRGNRAARIA